VKKLLMIAALLTLAATVYGLTIRAEAKTDDQADITALENHR
jgi:hypothetical protein